MSYLKTDIMRTQFTVFIMTYFRLLKIFITAIFLRNAPNKVARKQTD